MVTFFSQFDILEIVKAFIALFIVIDILGSIPIIIDLENNGKQVHAFRATFIAFLFMLAFFYIGLAFLGLFNVNIEDFAVAGALILFFLALEMILDVEIFKNQGPTQDATLVPLVFPLLAGTATFTTLLSLKADYHDINILIALVLNMVWVYVVLRAAKKVEQMIGKSGLYILRKLFGIILLAIAVKMFTANLSIMLANSGL